ncbi:hypothetical protein Mp_2g14090 [Marchantia polymorpha subsp. ruderalis]|uniref:HAT C-terminal dimerisation domain-containing protein n=1 Tax=Marchantia polymorpha TaxID=3197 RepID=A0A2R6X1K9_MARPO|nr:hypothetical protein MARPO_0042s0038 [Marchantia polymorpha]BBN02288.1 hypothetical protein Mp_2g14090 [Marchantia polymorpha subsp. ruderalis]|eukprot:PTQ39989.1 hypothetical protein MARPO_0042s0038 [Marchantia polymorpha]
MTVEMSSKDMLTLKTKITADLQKEDGLYYRVKNRKARAGVWTSFSFVAIKETGEHLCYSDNFFVCCNKCLTVYQYRSANGTTAMSKHSCPPAETNQVMTATATRRDATTSEKKLITVALADMCAVDMRPFYIVKGTGFRNYTQTVLNIGVNSKVGMLVDNILPDPTTISRNVQMRSNAGREILTAALKAHLAEGIQIGSTTDIWTDDINKVSFLSVTVHFIDDEFTLHHRTLACSPFPGPHHGCDVLEKYEGVLRKFGINRYDQVTVVTDRGSNMHSADGIPSLYGWIPCCDHIISTILTTTRELEWLKFYHLALELFDTIDQVKALVTYVKQANLQDEIAETLKQENATRWNSALRCMISVDEALPELTEILRARGRGLVSKVNKIDHELLKEFIAFLVPFQEATLALEMFAEPTIHRVLYFRQNLLKHCQVVAADITTKEKDGTITTLKKDSPAFIALKPKFAELIREKFIWSDIHVIAALLNPKTKCRLDKFGIDSVDIELGQKNLENMMKDHMIGSGIGKRSVPSHKRKKEYSRRVVRRLAEYSSESDSTIEEKPLADDVQLDFSLRTELNNYICHRCSDDESTLLSKYGVLFWWKIHQNEFPVLSRLARSVLTIPASSAKSESNFSDAGNTMSKKRNLLHPSKLDDLMFLRSMLMSSTVQIRVPPITES